MDCDNSAPTSSELKCTSAGSLPSVRGASSWASFWSNDCAFASDFRSLRIGDRLRLAEHLVHGDQTKHQSNRGKDAFAGEFHGFSISGEQARAESPKKSYPTAAYGSSDGSVWPDEDRVGRVERVKKPIKSGLGVAVYETKSQKL
jgi:hypothetical protein